MVKEENHPSQIKQTIASFRWEDTFGMITLSDYRSDDGYWPKGGVKFRIDIYKNVKNDESHKMDEDYLGNHLKVLYNQTFDNFDDAYRLLEFIEKQIRTEELYNGWREENNKRFLELFEE